MERGATWRVEPHGEGSHLERGTMHDFACKIEGPMAIIRMSLKIPQGLLNEALLYLLYYYFPIHQSSWIHYSPFLSF